MCERVSGNARDQAVLNRIEAEAKSLVTRRWVFISKMLQDSVSVERMMEIVRRYLWNRREL